MNAIRTLWGRLLATFQKSSRDRDLAEELAAHTAFLVEENLRRGMTEEQALRAARVTVGNFESNKELHRDARGLPLLDHLIQDLGYTFRTLRRDPAFTAFAILIVGLGIGAAVTVFSVVNALLLRPLPFRNPSELVWIANTASEGLSQQTTQVGHLTDLQAQSRSFAAIGGYFAFYGDGDLKLTGDGEAERLTAVPVSQNFFSLLGVQPQLGRGFNDEESKFRGARAVLLSYAFWQRRFGGDLNIVGRKLILDGKPTPVIGVMPESFDFGAIFHPGRRFDLFTVVPLTQEINRMGNTMAMIGRLNPGVTLSSAQAETTILAKQFVEAHPRDRNTFGGFLTPLAEHVSGSVRPALVVVVCAVGAVMLIVCANLSNLLLGRTASRQKEIAIRTALGAGRGRLIRQMLTESVTLSFCGATLGLLLAWLGTRSIAHLESLKIPLLQDVRLDVTALAFAICAATLCGLAFGLLPAFHIPGFVPQDALKDGGRGSTQGGGYAWARKGLVAAEVAFACMLLIGSGLLIRSLMQVLDVNLGFRPERAATIRIDPDSRYKTQAERNAYFSEALRLVRDLPGVTGAGITDSLPLGRNRSWGTGAEGVQYDPSNYPEAYPRIVSDGYFQAMGVQLRAGRDFTPRDTPDSERVIILNESFARALWPGQDPLGKRVLNNGPVRVVGVVADVRHLALEKASGNEMYIPIRQTQDYGNADLVVRSTLSTRDLASRVREALSPLEPNLPGKEFRTLDTLVDHAISPRRVVVLLLTGFAGFALLLASLGIYAVISYSVSQRSQELGIRLALGASAGTLQRGILSETLVLSSFGLLAGITGGWVASHWLRALLFGITENDPVTFAASIAVIGCIAVVAAYIPARRISQIDPSIALRAD